MAPRPEPRLQELREEKHADKQRAEREEDRRVAGRQRGVLNRRIGSIGWGARSSQATKAAMSATPAVSATTISFRLGTPPR